MNIRSAALVPWFVMWMALSIAAQAPTSPQKQAVGSMKTKLDRAGGETVSFGLHIAPILIEHCGRCHMSNNNVPGNFDQKTFLALLSGGDAGPPITPGDPSKSLLFQRISAGEMPPTGKLDAPLIALIETWIDEGAKFDGRDPQATLISIAAVAKVQSQTHGDLLEARKNQATKTWQLAMGPIEGASKSSKNFIVTGAIRDDRLDDVSQLLEEIAPKVTKALKANPDQPLVKGNISVFVFSKRYDFSEFGKMVEQRNFPKQVTGHWGYTIEDAYATILLTRNQTAEDAKVVLTQQIAALQVAGLASDVPRWFADGVGYWVTKRVFPRDPAVKKLDADAADAASTMKQPDDFVNQRMPSDQAGKVSYLFVKHLRAKASNFNRLLESMRDGDTFEESFKRSYGASAAEMLGQPGHD